jgi:hypothetical protein
MCDLISGNVRAFTKLKEQTEFGKPSVQNVLFSVSYLSIKIKIHEPVMLSVVLYRCGT